MKETTAIYQLEDQGIPNELYECPICGRPDIDHNFVYGVCKPCYDEGVTKK